MLMHIIVLLSATINPFQRAGILLRFALPLKTWDIAPDCESDFPNSLLNPEAQPSILLSHSI